MGVFFREFFSRALLSERLEQAKNLAIGLALFQICAHLRQRRRIFIP